MLSLKYPVDIHRFGQIALLMGIVFIFHTLYPENGQAGFFRNPQIILPAIMRQCIFYIYGNIFITGMEYLDMLCPALRHDKYL